MWEHNRELKYRRFASGETEILVCTVLEARDILLRTVRPDVGSRHPLGVDETLKEMEVEMSIHPNTIDQSVLLQAVVLRRCNSEVSQELKNVYLRFVLRWWPEYCQHNGSASEKMCKLTAWTRSSSKYYLRIQPVLQTERYKDRFVNEV
jgi:hypothetical protein